MRAAKPFCKSAARNLLHEHGMDLARSQASWPV